MDKIYIYNNESPCENVEDYSISWGVEGGGTGLIIRDHLGKALYDATNHTDGFKCEFQ